MTLEAIVCPNFIFKVLKCYFFKEKKYSILIIVPWDLIIAPQIEKWLLLFKIYLHILYNTYGFNKKKDMKILIHNVENYSLQNSFSKIIRKIDENKIKKIK